METTGDIAKKLRQCASVVVSTHIRPDGDAIGSSLGLARILSTAGKTACVADIEPIHRKYSFLPKPGEFSASGTIDASQVDAIVVLDAGALDRAQPFVADWMDRVPVINIDHHQSNTLFGTMNLVDTEASSVGEMVYRIATEAGFEIPQPAAEALWVAIVTDTGRFAYSNTSPEVMTVAADLLRRGIDTTLVDHLVFNSLQPSRLRLQQRAIASLQLHESGRVATVSLSRKDFQELGCNSGDAEEIINIPRSLEGVEVALFFHELFDEPAVKVGFRTIEPYDAAALCRSLGGGGHQRAAGCSFDGTMENAQKSILTRIHNEWFGVSP